jgi:hypothetical protein
MMMLIVKDEKIKDDNCWLFAGTTGTPPESRFKRKIDFISMTCYGSPLQLTSQQPNQIEEVVKIQHLPWWDDNDDDVDEWW